MELSKEEKKTIEELEEFIEDDEIQNISVFTAKKIKNIIDNQQKEIERIKSLDIYKLTEEWETGQLIHKDKIKEKQKELEEQKEKLKYDGNRCFADYEQFCKNLKFFNEQIEELLEDN